MTTETNKYSRGKVYKIYRDDCPEIYIGSTTASTLACRLSQHVSSAKKEIRICMSRQLVNRPGYYITLLEAYSCNTRDELRAREQFYIDTMNNVVNGNKAYADKESVQVYHKQYYEENRERILNRNRQYAARTTEQKRVTNQAYYERNKEKIIARSLQKVTCECGCIVTRACMLTHRKTKKHQKLMAAQSTPLQ